MNLQNRCLLCSVMLVLSATGEQVPQKLIDGLSSEHFKERESSQSELAKWVDQNGPGAVKDILKIYQESDDPEVRLRCQNILRTQSEKDYLNDGQGYLGVQLWEEILNVPDDEKPRIGIRLTVVMPGSPAEAAGLKAGDVIASMDGQKWYERGALNQLITTVASYKPRRKVVFMIKRPGQEILMEIPVILGKRPVQDLSQLYYNNIQEVEKQARDRHFEEWLQKQETAP